MALCRRPYTRYCYPAAHAERRWSQLQQRSLPYHGGLSRPSRKWSPAQRPMDRFRHPAQQRLARHMKAIGISTGAMGADIAPCGRTNTIKSRQSCREFPFGAARQRITFFVCGGSGFGEKRNNQAVNTETARASHDAFPDAEFEPIKAFCSRPVANAHHRHRNVLKTPRPTKPPSAFSRMPPLFRDVAPVRRERPCLSPHFTLCLAYRGPRISGKVRRFGGHPPHVQL